MDDFFCRIYHLDANLNKDSPKYYPAMARPMHDLGKIRL